MGALRFGEPVLLLVLLTVLAPPLGRWVARSMEGEPAFGDRIFGPAERLVFAACGIRPHEESGWRGYAAALLAFNLLGIVLLFLLQRFQDVLPMNPAALGPVRPDLAFNTSVSFVTNTNWQAYAGETTLSAFVQMAGLTVQNFLSAATGLCAAVALCRGFARRESPTVGNFWVDVTRATVRILLPLSLLLSLVLLSQGVVQTLAPGTPFVTVEGAPSVLPGGLVASQEAVKLVGTNGGGYFNANSAHPFENPTPL
jgi:K+-transporting ATPase ATPase A chain